MEYSSLQQAFTTAGTRMPYGITPNRGDIPTVGTSAQIFHCCRTVSFHPLIALSPLLIVIVMEALSR